MYYSFLRICSLLCSSIPRWLPLRSQYQAEFTAQLADISDQGLELHMKNIELKERRDGPATLSAEEMQRRKIYLSQAKKRHTTAVTDGKRVREH